MDEAQAPSAPSMSLELRKRRELVVKRFGIGGSIESAAGSVSTMAPSVQRGSLFLADRFSLPFGNAVLSGCRNC